MRRTIAVALLVGVACVAMGEDKDPIKEKLFAAKVAYDKEMRQFRKQVDEWFDKRESTARQSGDKKTLDQLKEDRKAYEEDDELPKSIPTALKQKQDRARKALETAYAEAVKAYTKAKKDDEAAAVEALWKEFAAQTGSINLLDLVNPKTHAVAGEWKKDGKVLVGANGNNRSRLQLPYEPGEEYDLEVKCKRTVGRESFGVGLVAGGRQVLAMTDAWPDHGFRSALNFVDNKEGTNNVTTLKGEVLKSDVPLSFTYTVRSDKIEIALNGKVLTTFKGEFTRLSLDDRYVVRNKKALFLYTGPQSTYHIERIRLKPLKGKGTILK